ncbi:MAG: HAMP domain-containing histidine kinase [Balneolaceae bacterium]|nr:HAMP domain-containing histidine kinase [Balneolaceae bacterium]
MYKDLTLRNRIFVISTALVVVSFVLLWIFIRPEYKKAIINERTTIVSQLQEYSLMRADETIRDWLNATSFLAEDVIQNPGQVEAIARRAINYTPGLIRISINEIGATQSVEFTRSIFENLTYPDEISNWYESRLDPRTNVSWVSDTTQDFSFFTAQRALQIDSFDESGNTVTVLLNLTMFFNGTGIATELRDIPLGGNYSANIVTETGENLFPNQQLEFPQELVGDASYSEETVIRLNGDDWFVMSSRFQTLPYWHLIAVEDNFILEPVNNLVLYSLFTALGILLLLVVFSFYVSLRINRPIENILRDVDYISNLDFDHAIREVELPEFKNMRETLENIRITLHRYQKINVEKIILEEWKNRYIMTYSEDLIGILDNSGKFRFANNHFVEFIEGFGKNPHDVAFQELLDSPKVELTKSNQTVHFPNPYSIKINRAELAHFVDEETTYFYDYQYVSFEDEEQNPQGALVILHDKTKDRLVDMKRTDMINIIVHELKNPITGVVGLSKLMIDNSSMSADEQRDLLKEIYLSGERMNDLVNRFLDVQRLEHGRIPVEFAQIDLFQIVNDVKSVTNSLLTQKNLKIEIIAKGTNFVTKGSKDLLFDAIQNLVSNAIKYGDKDRTIEVELEESEKTIEISVTDFGYGISLEDQKKVFDKFFRVRSNIKAAREKGTGLGLAYVKEIVNRHEGDVLLESNDKIGSRFTIVLPKLGADTD